MEEQNQEFRSWAIIELFGHSQIAGEVSESSIGGCSFLRVDVPESDGHPAFTKFYGNGAIYSMTPVEEVIARHAIKMMRPKPVRTYYLPSLKRDDEVYDDDLPEDYDF